MEQHNHNNEKRARGRPKKATNSVVNVQPKEQEHTKAEPVVIIQSLHEQPKAQVKVETVVVVNPLKKDAPVENYFILCNSKPIKNLKELADMMGEFEDSVFNFHVKPGRNDFAVWVENIFKDMELAKKMMETKDKKNLQLLIYKHLTHKLW